MTSFYVEAQERKLYENWLKNLLSKYGNRLNYFETNLEVWRQLWRVLEKSDIILLVVDARYPSVFIFFLCEIFFVFLFFLILDEISLIPFPAITLQLHSARFEETDGFGDE